MMKQLHEGADSTISGEATNAVLVQVYSVQGRPVIPLYPPDDRERGFQRNV